LRSGPITKAQKALLPTPYGEKTANLHGPKASLPHPFAWCRNLFGASVGSFLVPRKVRFLAMAMFEQARRCSFGLTKTFYKLGKAAWDSDIQFTEPTQTRNN